MKWASVGGDTDREFNLVANQVELYALLTQIAAKSGIRLHNPQPSHTRITANCQGTVESVLKCVLGTDAKWVFRYSPVQQKSSAPRLLEAWLLGEPASTDLSGNVETAPADLPQVAQADEILARAKDPKRRMEAIADLAMLGSIDNPAVRKELASALKDKNPGVRGQAVLTLSRANDDGAKVLLQQAFQDSDPEVRQLALESLGDNRLLLQQALKDNNQNIRQYAETKLGILNNRNY